MVAMEKTTPMLSSELLLILKAERPKDNRKNEPRSPYWALRHHFSFRPRHMRNQPISILIYKPCTNHHCDARKSALVSIARTSIRQANYLRVDFQDCRVTGKPPATLSIGFNKRKTG